jgi:hypothetical protein
MLNDATYRQWTAAFHEGSYYRGSWEQGSDIQFVSDDKDGQSGMAGKIAANRPYEFISIEYIGEISNGQVDTTSDSAKQWVGGRENYTFHETNGVTTIDVDLSGAAINPDMLAMFDGMWPAALAKLKELAEQQ